MAPLTGATGEYAITWRAPFHPKAVFGKLGVTRRQDLIAALAGNASTQ